jgi:RNA polymerase sigma-70 factor (ECF subfamily)
VRDRMDVTPLSLHRGPATLEELERVYRRDGAAFERVAIAIVGDELLGCDAVHDAFVLALRNRGGFRREGPVEAWLWRIVINEARKRRAHRSELLVTEAGSLDAEDAVPNGETDSGRIRALIAALPERQRLVLFLRHYADLDYATIAHALDVAPGTVAATLNAARERLRAQLEEVHEWER